MEFEQRLLQILEQASSPSAALDQATQAIAQDELSDTCGIFLAGPEGQLALWARSHQDLDGLRRPIETVVREALAAVRPAASTHGSRAIVAAPLLSHARPIGALVTLRDAGRPYAPAEVRRLVGIASRIAGVIERARAIDMIRHVMEAPARGGAGAPQRDRIEQVLEGIAASPGAGIGRCVFRQTFPRHLLRFDAGARAPEVERARLRGAIEKTRNDLKRLEAAIAGELGEQQALVFGSHLLFLSDPSLLESLERGISAGFSAALAVDRAWHELATKLSRIGDAYIRERIEDLEDLCSRLLSHLLGASHGTALDAELVVSPRATPSLIVELHGRGAIGIASELGGSTSHAVLLARALGFPAVTGVRELLEQTVAGEPLIVDGDRGIVILAPTARTIAEYRAAIDARERARTEFARYRERAAETVDGMRFALRANVAFGADIELARINNAEGIGLYRTEFPFIVRDGIPTIEEQACIYEKAYQAFPGHPVVFRILDLAADKLLLGAGLDAAGRAFQGYRSMRLLFDHPYILRDQVQAFAIAAGRRTLSIMIPMVSSIEELRRTKELIAAALAELPDAAGRHVPRIGVLIEVPAAVEIAADLAREADFVSIGTNDLMQYALVIDREDARLSTPLDAFHPAVLRMIHKIVVGSHSAGREVSVCGEIATRPEVAFVLLALGVDALSVTPRAIPALKQWLAQVEVAPLRRDVERIIGLARAQDIERAVRAHIEPAS